jgi:valyl-tRNA synthetase
MVMLDLELTGEIPFRDVYVHSVIQAPDGRRMSKSLGTGIDPVTLIDQYGADAVRFGLLAMSSTQDVRFSEEKIGQGRALANKLFNATRFVLGKVDGAVPAAPRPVAVEDRWILSRLQAAKADATQRVEGFDFAKAALGLYDFVYGELCDWYLELIKGREVDEDLSATLQHVLRETLVLAHPVIPFVTEELWEHVPGTDGLLAAEQATAPDPALRDPEAEAAIAAVIEAVGTVRGWRDDAGVRPGAVLPARLAADGFDPGMRGLVGRLARLDLTAEGEAAASVGIPGGVVEVLAGGEFDPAEADRRKDGQRATLDAEIARARKKLGNEGFVAKAKPEVVQAEREKLARLEAEREALA